MFQTLSVAYASEICPVCLRGPLTTYANICWVIGQILATGVLRGLLSSTNEWYDIFKHSMHLQPVLTLHAGATASHLRSNGCSLPSSVLPLSLLQNLHGGLCDTATWKELVLS